MADDNSVTFCRNASPNRWAVIADDLTGACDTGAIFAQKGFSTVVILDRRLVLRTCPQMTVLTTGSRNDNAGCAHHKVLQACRYLKNRNRNLLYKKIDSTLKGNIVAEVQVAAKAAGFTRILFCPAYPAQGRQVRHGTLYVRGQRLAELRSLFSVRPDCAIAEIHRPVSRKKIARAIREGSTWILSDAETDRDLRCLVTTADDSTKRVLLAGSGGLTTQVAECLRKLTSTATARRNSAKDASNLNDRTNAQPIELKSVPPLIFSGSRNSVTEHQIDRLVRSRKARVCPLSGLAGAAVQDLLAKDHVVVLRVPIYDRPDSWIRHELNSLASILSPQCLSSLVLIGGDTASLILRWLSAKAIHLHGEIAPGIPWGRILGGRLNGVLLSTKAGGFGQPDTLIRVAKFLTLPEHFAV
ncbi:MAG: four-carbon acid sugar kinase family protein [Verrucomicrobia bacterium]|nr:four-carbon acid sugar kinase family protein [Verrucomicrobiota bacterium]